MSVFCPSCYDARHRKPRRCVYVLNLGGTGIRPPDSFSYRSNFRFRSSFRSRSCSTTSGDIFYCSGSKQLNHSSYRAMHFSAYARSWDRMSSVRLSVAVDCDDMGWKCWKLTAQTTRMVQLPATAAIESPLVVELERKRKLER